MVDSLLAFSAVFAASTAAAGFALSVVAWQLFRGSPFGLLIGFLSAILFILAGYHSFLLIIDVSAVPILESVAFTGLLVWVVLMIRQHRLQSRRPIPRVSEEVD